MYFFLEFTRKNPTEGTIHYLQMLFCKLPCESINLGGPATQLVVPGKEQKNICVAAHNDYNLDAGRPGKIARESWFKGSYKEFWAIFDGQKVPKISKNFAV